VLVASLMPLVLVAADLDELEHRGPACGGAGEKAGSEAVAREVGGVVAHLLGVVLHDLGDALGSESIGKHDPAPAPCGTRGRRQCWLPPATPSLRNLLHFALAARCAP